MYNDYINIFGIGLNLIFM